MATPDDPTTPAELDRSTGGQQPTVTVTTRPSRAGPPRRRVTGRRPRRRAPILLAASVAAVLAASQVYALTTALLIIMLRAGGGGPDFGDLFGLGASGWLLVHGVPVEAVDGTVSLIPLALTGFAGWRLYRAGIHTLRAIGGRRTGSPRYAVVAGGATGLAYSGICAGVAWLSRFAPAQAGPGRAALTGFLFAFVVASAGAGSRKGCGAWARLGALLPPVVPSAARTGLGAALLVWAGGAVAAGTALAVAGGEASRYVSGPNHAGFGSQLGITLLCLPYVPDVAFWGAAYLGGPGFTIGTVQISVAKVTAGFWPTFPILAGVPDSSASGFAAGLLFAPVLAGAIAAWSLPRRHRRWGELLAAAVLAAVIAGGLLGAGAYASSGQLRGFADQGAPVWPVMWWSAAVIGLGSLVAAVVAQSLRPDRGHGGRRGYSGGPAA